MESRYPFGLFVSIALSVLALGGCASQVAAVAPANIDDTTILGAARRMMIDMRYCALITIGDDGQPQARTIDPSSPDSRMVVSFATVGATRKVGQIERDSRVTLYYFDPRSPGYVTLIGTARPVSDVKEKQRRWLEKWTPFYPGGAEGSILYEVIPVRIEVVDVARGVVGDPETWLPPSISFAPQ